MNKWVEFANNKEVCVENRRKGYGSVNHHGRNPFKGLRNRPKLCVLYRTKRN
jgi:hypothetical protein